MKKTVGSLGKICFGFAVLGFVFGGSALFAADKKAAPIDKHDVEKFFYDKGYKDGYTSGRRAGYAEAKKDFIAKLKRYRKRIKAMEAGKYLSRKHKITAPEIYQKKREDGSIQIVVRGCRIEKELTPSEILALPEYGSDKYSSEKSYSSDYVSGKGGGSEPLVSNNAFLPGIDTKNMEIPRSSRSHVGVTYRFFRDNETNRRIFRGAGRPFSIVDGQRLKVVFPSEKDAAEFCHRYGLTPGRDYQ